MGAIDAAHACVLGMACACRLLDEQRDCLQAIHALTGQTNKQNVPEELQAGGMVADQPPHLLSRAIFILDSCAISPRKLLSFFTIFFLNFSYYFCSLIIIKQTRGV